MIDPMTLSYDNSECREVAAELLRRHGELQAEANITSAIRDFLIRTGLVETNEIREEISPAEGSSNSVDLAALDTLIEVKRRIGNGIVPDAAHDGQLDNYLEAAMEASKGVRIGVLTDGKYWVLRWPNAVMINTSPPYAFTLTDADKWYALYEWLWDNVLVARRDIEPTSEEIREQFSPDSPLYEREIDTLRALYEKFSGYETVAVKRRLWHDLLRTALGEVVQADEFDDLFVRHTYLTIVVGIVVQASFGMDVNQIAENDPDNLVSGRQFAENTGLHGVVGVGLLRLAGRGGCDAVDTDDRTTGGAFRLVGSAVGYCCDAVPDGDTGTGEARPRRVLHAALVGEGDRRGDCD